MTDEEIEALAIRAAKGNNGGEWLKRPDGTQHYTEAQKDYWRQWVRDMGAKAYAAGFKAGYEAGENAGFKEGLSEAQV
jgi:hypothetical protein